MVETICPLCEEPITDGEWVWAHVGRCDGPSVQVHRTCSDEEVVCSMVETTCPACGSTYQTGEGWEAHTPEACVILALRRRCERLEAVGDEMAEELDGFFPFHTLPPAWAQAKAKR